MTKQGDGKVRLAFAKGTNKVIEAKSLKTGKVHTSAEFAADEAGKAERTAAEEPE